MSHGVGSRTFAPRRRPIHAAKPRHETTAMKRAQGLLSQCHKKHLIFILSEFWGKRSCAEMRTDSGLELDVTELAGKETTLSLGMGGGGD